MKQDLKICLPQYKVVYSIVFVVLLSFIRSISNVADIGPAMDSNMALLSILLCSDTFYQELKGNKYELFSRISLHKKKQVILNRIICEIIYLLLLAAVSYWIFYFQKPVLPEGGSHLTFYIMALGAFMGSVLFFGTLSIFLTNIMFNLWAGIGIGLVVWLFLNSKFAVHILPPLFRIFAFGNRTFPEELYDLRWVWGKVVSVLLGFILLMIQFKLIRKGKRYSICQ